MKLRLEKCSLQDLSLLTRIARKTFVDAFEAQNNPEDFEAYTSAAFSEAVVKTQILNSNCTFYFVKDENEVVGYFKLNENEAQTELKGNETIELERIYVLHDHQGRKIGQWMLEQIIAKAKDKHKKFLWLGVWEHNIAAIRFYQRHGFEKFGEHPYYVGKDKQMDWLMKIDLVTLTT